MVFRSLYIDQAVAESPLVESISRRLNMTGNRVANAQEVYDIVAASEDPVKTGKELLFLTHNKGSFIKSCPGTRFYRCCGYKILHVGTFCHMDCTYCILQSYFHPPVLQFFVNHDDLFNELSVTFADKKVYRIGTGEFTDSLIWELWTDLSTRLIPAFASQKHAILELKTKTTAVERLRTLRHNRKTVVAWSVNTPRIIAEEERYTSSLTARLKAAATCASWGYPVAFHFDPIVIYDGCEADYKQTVTQLFSYVSPEKIMWISLGTFRFMPSLKALIQKRFPDSTIIYGEFITGLDSKMRYFKPLRIGIYQKLIAYIQAMAPRVLTYLCMEDDEVWHKSMGFVPTDRGGLSRMLDDRAINQCDLVAD